MGSSALCAPATAPLPRNVWAPASRNLSVTFFQKSEMKLRADGTAGVTSTDEALNPYWATFKASLARQARPCPTLNPGP